MITNDVENYTKIQVKVFVILYANCCLTCYCNFNKCGNFEKMTSFSAIPSQDLEERKLMAEIKFQKPRCQIFVKVD